MINSEPITHEYDDVEKDNLKQNAKIKNFKRTFVDQSNFSYFNTILDEDLAQKKMLKRNKTRQRDLEQNKYKLILQNGDVIEENSDELDNMSDDGATFEKESLQDSPSLKEGESQEGAKNLCQ